MWDLWYTKNNLWYMCTMITAFWYMLMYIAVVCLAAA